MSVAQQAHVQPIEFQQKGIPMHSHPLATEAWVLSQLREHRHLTLAALLDRSSDPEAVDDALNHLSRLGLIERYVPNAQATFRWTETATQLLTDETPLRFSFERLHSMIRKFHA